MGEVRLPHLAALAAVSVLVCAIVPARLAVAQPQSSTLVDNATVEVRQFRVAASGEYEFSLNGMSTVFVDIVDSGATFVPASARRHRIVNTRAAPLTLIAIGIKSTRAPAPAAPPTAAPPGISRATVIDNDEVRVVRVRFDATGREPVHAHPNDLLTVQLTTGRVEMLIGSEKTSALREPGFVRFVPRDVAHAYASADTKPFDILSVAVK